MEKNVGSLDAMLRVVMGLALLIVATVVAPAWVLSVAAVAIALVLLYTALSERCPLYRVFHWSTRHEPHAPVGPTPSQPSRPA